MRVVLFGSLPRDRATVASDVDILLVVSGSQVRPLDRQLVYRDYFSGIGLSVDLFVYTQAEVASGQIPIVENALQTGRTLYQA